MIWRLAHGPFVATSSVISKPHFEQLRAEVARRLAAEIEPVPSWARDGVYVSGSDPRFAGSWAGLENMVERGVRLDPSAPGVTLHAGSGPAPSTRTETRTAAQLGKAIEKLEANLTLWERRAETTRERLTKTRAARQALPGSPDATPPAAAES